MFTIEEVESAIDSLLIAITFKAAITTHRFSTNAAQFSAQTRSKLRKQRLLSVHRGCVFRSMEEPFQYSPEARPRILDEQLGYESEVLCCRIPSNQA